MLTASFRIWQVIYGDCNLLRQRGHKILDRTQKTVGHGRERELGDGRRGIRREDMGMVSYGGPGGRATRRCLCDDDDATIDDGDATIDDGDATIDDDDATIDDGIG